MNKFKLSNLIEENLKGLSPIQTIMKMTEEQNIITMGLNPEEAISFGGGWCNHYTPETLREIYKEIVEDKQLFHRSGRYSPIKGDYKLREQLCYFEEKIYNVKDLTADNIILGHSSTQLFHDILRAVINPSEDICALDPTYANYINSVKCAIPGCHIKFIPALNPETWRYLEDIDESLEVLKKYCSRGVKLFVIPIPDNPTSQIPPEKFISSAQEILLDYKGFILLDFAYKALWFNNMPQCYSWSPADKPNLITLHSNSKWLSSLGRRLGWVEAEPYIISALEKLNESTLLSPDTMHSITTAQFLEKTLADNSLRSFIDETRKLYKNTADFMMKCIDRYLGWKYLKPMGGLYTCSPTPNMEEPTVFVEKLLRETGVLLIPGEGFGPSLEYGLRLSYGPLCYQHELIEEGIKRISEYLKKMK